MSSCQICDKAPYTAFNWKYANERKDKGLARLAAHFREIRSLKFGSLFECPLTHSNWFLDDEKVLLYAVPADKLELFRQWDSRPLDLTSSQIKILSRIGATESDYGVGSAEIRIPCAVTRGSGAAFDPVVLVITKMPPIEPSSRIIRLGESSDSIATSDFALPIAVRTAALCADELAMGFAPTLVQATDGRRFVLNGPTQVFAYGELKGNQIALCEDSYQREDKYPIMAWNSPQPVFLYFDWFSGCRDLTRGARRVTA